MGGIRKSTWKKGEPPPVQRPKGSKNKRTVLKEAIGLKDWDGFKTFVETEGSTKLVREIKKLKGRNYVMAIQALVEFVKPKLSRVDATVKGNVHLSDIPITFE